MLARDERRLAQLREELDGSMAVACDVANAVALRAAVTEVESAFGSVDVLVHNAVRGTRGDVLTMMLPIWNATSQSTSHRWYI